MVCARLTKMLMAVKVNMTDITQRLYSTHRNLMNSTCDSAEERVSKWEVGFPRGTPNSFRAGSENKVKQYYTGAKEIT